MMGGPATGRMFGGLNNISNGLLKNLGGLGGNGGLGGLGSLLGGGLGGNGGLGGLGSLLGGGMGGLGGLGNLVGMLGGNGGLGGLGSLAGMMGGMGGKKPGTGNNNFDINSIIGALGGNGGGNNGGLDLNAIFSQLGNMQQQSAKTAPPEPEPSEEPIREARFKPTDEPNTGFAEERFQDPGKQATGTNQNTAAGGMPNINPELLQMLNNFLGGMGKQANQGQQGNRPRHGKPGATGQQNAYRQQSANKQGEQHCAAEAQATAQPAAQHRCDTCFDCPLNCPRAGLKLPAYAQVRQLAQGWQRY